MAECEETPECLEDLLHCMICFEQYDSPRILRCGHTFCENCLNSCLVVYQNKLDAKAGKLPCPTCRRLTRLPTVGIAGLPHDFRVNKLREVLEHITKRDAATERLQTVRKCDLCKSQGKNAISEFYCTDCLKHLCGLCVKKHDSSIFQSHNVVNLAKDSVQVTFCKEHKTEPTKYFCQTCDKLECSLGVMMEHNGHKVVEINTAIKTQRNKLHELLKQLNSNLSQATTQRAKLEAIANSKLDNYKDMKSKIEQTARERIASIQSQEFNLLSELDTKTKMHQKTIQTDLEALNFHIGNIQNLADFARARLHLKNRHSQQLIAFSNELISRINTIKDTEIPQLKTEFTTETLTFVPSDDVQNLGQLEDCSNFTKGWMFPNKKL